MNGTVMPLKAGICIGFMAAVRTWVITNTRIIDVDVTGILFRHVAETKLELIQDVSYQQTGVIPSFFDYGTVLIQTAAEQANFEIDHSPQPSETIQIIGDLIGKKRRL